MKKKLPFGKAVPPTSERFHLAMEYALDHLEEKEEKRVRRKLSFGAVLALVLALALMATAFALTNGFGILGFYFGGNQASEIPESAQALVQTDLGMVEKYGYRIRLSEAVYAGPNVLLLVDVTIPAGSPKLYSMGAMIGPEGMSRDAGAGLQAESVRWEYLGSPDLPEGVTYRAYIEKLIEEEPPAVIELNVSIPMHIPENTLSEPREYGDEAFEEELLLVARIPQTQRARSASFAADEEAAAAAGLEILSMQAQYTDLDAIVTIEYAMEGHEVQGEFYGTPKGTFFHTDPTCQGMKNAVVLESTAGKNPCPVCVSRDANVYTGQEYIAEGSPYSHLDPECDLLAGLAPVPNEDPLARQPCPHCWGLERRVRFHALDREGNPIAMARLWEFANVDVAVRVDAQGRIVRRQVLRMQTAAEIPASLLLSVEEVTNDYWTNYISGPGEVLCDPIPCEREE